MYPESDIERIDGSGSEWQCVNSVAALCQCLGSMTPPSSMSASPSGHIQTVEPRLMPLCTLKATKKRSASCVQLVRNRVEKPH